MEELLDQLARSGDGSLRQTLLDELGTALDVHLTFEESEIHPMVVVIDERVAADATSDHALLRTAFERLQQHDGVDAGDFAAAVDRLTAGLSRHAADEEFDAFPRLRLEVDVIVLDVLGEHLLAAHRSASGQAAHGGGPTADMTAACR